jgi:tRNA threonylcarbamoyladenosine biosynthesis protein TsaB
LEHLDFIAVTVGPGPFTTLRVAIATINGLAYGSAIPLIPIDGFEVMIHTEKESCTTPYLGIMLNAFSDDVYCALHNRETGKTTTACVNIAIWCEQLATLIAQHKEQPCITLCGNGTTLYREQLKTLDAQKIIVKTESPSNQSTCEAMAHIALSLWHKGSTKKMLLPQYMKATSALIKK